jgi:hypothetical protein
MSHPVRMPPLARVRAGLSCAWRTLVLRSSALFAVLVAYSIGVFRVLLMFVKNPELLPLALRAPLAYRRNRGNPSSTLPALVRVSEGIWRVPCAEPEPDEEAFSEAHGFEGDEERPRCVVLHYTGTGESVHAAYENTQHLFVHEPELRAATHYIFEAPLHKGAYYGAEPFSASLWERVLPIVSHYDGPFVLVGTSRGALVALEHGMRVVEECGKVASILALSAPLDMPRRIPVSIRTIADFVDVLTRFAEVWSQLLSPVRQGLIWIIADIYVMLTALILRHHGVYDLDSLTRNARDLTDHGVLGGSLRASREFRLLLRTSERELSLFRHAIARALLRHHERFFVALVWGKNDVWIDAEQCQVRMLEVARACGEGQEASFVLLSEVLEGQGHLLWARDQAAHAAHRAHLSHLVSCALSARARPPELDPTLSLRQARDAFGQETDD